jgi:hypothetical protein
MLRSRMTMNWATQHTASSHAEPELCLLSVAGVSATPGLAVASTPTTAYPTANGALND